ncbi:MAG: ATP synthase F1 subunit gamma [Clostridiales bacterium]|nr:MAG: ATP synthase F1 subunit gamma [Clostridiales bacterium]
MAGVGARDIKRRIKSVNSTKQITKAMELVSTAKLKRRRNALEATQPYYQATMEVVHHIAENEKSIDHHYLAARPVQQTLYIVIAADRGLCGGYNANALKCALNDIVHPEQTKIVAIGKKSIDFFKRQQFDLVDTISGISENPQHKDAKRIAQLVLDMYLQKEVDQIKLVYTKMKSTILQVADIITLLPLTVEDSETDESVKEANGNIFEEEIVPELLNYSPNPEAFINFLIPKYIESTLYGGLLESAASEQAARRMAMENATDNAEEMIEELTLYFNQARQAAITQEISEIVGGANAFD